VLIVTIKRPAGIPAANPQRNTAGGRGGESDDEKQGHIEEKEKAKMKKRKTTRRGREETRPA